MAAGSRTRRAKGTGKTRAVRRQSERVRPVEESARKRRAVLMEICKSLPEVQVCVMGRRQEHRGFTVRKKTFAYHLWDHHGDGRIALWCKAADGEQGRLVEEDSRLFFVPPYLGPRGWVGMRLDLPRLNWSQVALLVRSAYRLSAPRALAARVE
jgi:phosphoribosylglycinamide formyltransferase-1